MPGRRSAVSGKPNGVGTGRSARVAARYLEALDQAPPDLEGHSSRVPPERGDALSFGDGESAGPGLPSPASQQSRNVRRVHNRIITLCLAVSTRPASLNTQLAGDGTLPWSASITIRVSR